MGEGLTETFALLVSKPMLEELRKVHYERRDDFQSMAAFVRVAIQEKLDKD